MKHLDWNISAAVLHTCRQPSSTAPRDIQRAVFAEPDALAELCDFDSVFSVKTLNVVANWEFFQLTLYAASLLLVDVELGVPGVVSL